MFPWECAIERILNINLHLPKLWPKMLSWLETTTAYTQTFYGSLNFVWDNSGEPVPEETFTRSHLSWSSIVPYLLHPSNTIHGILPVQSTFSLFPQSLSKFSLVYLLAWHPPLHTPYISSPNHCLPFVTHAHTIATCFGVVLRLCHLILVSLSSSQPFTWNYILLLHTTHPTSRCHLCSLKCDLIFLSLPCNILLCTQLLYNLPLTFNDISLLVSNGANCLNLFHPIRICSLIVHV